MHRYEIRYTPWGKAQNISRLSDTNVLQECIPVGCVPSAAVAISPATHTPPAMHAPCHACPLPHMPPYHTHPPVMHALCHTHLPTMHAPLPHTPPCHACPLHHTPPVDRILDTCL